MPNVQLDPQAAAEVEAWTIHRLSGLPSALGPLVKEMLAQFPQYSEYGLKDCLNDLLRADRIRLVKGQLTSRRGGAGPQTSEGEEGEKLSEDEMAAACFNLLLDLFHNEELVEDSTGALYRRVSGGMFAPVDFKTIIPEASSRFYTDYNVLLKRKALERAFDAYPRVSGASPALRYVMFDHEHSDGSTERFMFVNRGDGTVFLVGRGNTITVGIETIPPDVRFVLSPAMGVMPEPNWAVPSPWQERPYDRLWQLRKLLRLTVDEFVQAIGWMVTAALTKYPCPLLYIEGPHGSGKTMMAYFIVNTVDTYKNMRVAVRRPATLEGDDFGLNVNANTTLLVDNVTTITQKMSDELALMITGGSEIKRKLYTNLERVLVEYRGAICLTSINTLGMGPDVVDRRVKFTVPANEERRGTGIMLAEYEAMLPDLLGDLLPLILECSHHIENGTSQHVRMVEYLNVLRYLDSLWGTHAAVLYERSHQADTAAALFDDVIGVPVLLWLDSQEDLTEFYPSDLYRRLSVLHSIDNKTWPTDAKAFSARLRRLDAAFKQSGYCFSRGDVKHRTMGFPILVSRCNPEELTPSEYPEDVDFDFSDGEG